MNCLSLLVGDKCYGNKSGTELGSWVLILNRKSLENIIFEQILEGHERV